jgi:hypothetical protein
MAQQVSANFAGKAVFSHDLMWVDVVSHHKLRGVEDKTPRVLLPPQLISNLVSDSLINVTNEGSTVL